MGQGRLGPAVDERGIEQPKKRRLGVKKPALESPPAVDCQDDLSVEGGGIGLLDGAHFLDLRDLIQEAAGEDIGPSGVFRGHHTKNAPGIPEMPVVAQLGPQKEHDEQGGRNSQGQPEDVACEKTWLVCVYVSRKG